MDNILNFAAYYPYIPSETPLQYRQEFGIIVLVRDIFDYRGFFRDE